jgi:hypothetical protein
MAVIAGTGGTAGAVYGKPTPNPYLTGQGYGSYFPPGSTVVSTPPPPTSYPIGGAATPAAAPAAQPASPSGSGSTGTTAPDLSHLDFSSDPILARIRALSQESISQAEADARAARTQLVIGYGDAGLANKLHLGGKVAQQAGGNSFGTLQELQRGYGRRNIFDIDRPLSDQANLFYSTERGRQRALSGEQYLRDQYNAEAAVQAKLSEISGQVTSSKMASQAQIIQAEQDAYQRAVQKAMYAVGL